MKVKCGLALLCFAVVSCAKGPQYQRSPSTNWNLHPTTCGGLDVTTGLQTWLDAGALSLNDGSAVAKWNDCVNTGFSVAQATASAQPTYSASGGTNGKPFVAFDGTKTYLAGDTSAITFTAGLTASFVINLADYSAKSTWNPIVYDDITGTGFTVSFFQTQFAPSIGLSGASNIGSGTYAGNTWYIVTFVENAAMTAIVEYQNGVPTGYDTAIKKFTANAPQLTLFSNNSHSLFTEGKLAEMLLYDALLSDDELATLTCYLSKKYGIGVYYCN